MGNKAVRAFKNTSKIKNARKKQFQYMISVMRRRRETSNTDSGEKLIIDDSPHLSIQNVETHSIQCSPPETRMDELPNQLNTTLCTQNLETHSTQCSPPETRMDELPNPLNTTLWTKNLETHSTQCSPPETRMDELPNPLNTTLCTKNLETHSTQCSPPETRMDELPNPLNTTLCTKNLETHSTQCSPPEIRMDEQPHPLKSTLCTQNLENDSTPNSPPEIRMDEVPNLHTQHATNDSIQCFPSATREGELPNLINQITGRRVVDIHFFLNKIKEISDHGKNFGCSFSNMDVVSEKKNGFSSSFKLICKFCGFKTVLPTTNTKDSDKLDVNSSAVAAIMSIGGGYSHLQEVSAMLDLPTVTSATYSKIHSEISKKWQETAIDSMIEAAAKERDAAIAEGRFSDDGVPIIDVIADGCWGKRSYKSKYSSLSGAAAIVGKRFGEVLFMAVRNKYCAVCSYYQRENLPVSEHTCFKNFEGPSTGMESEILLEGFQKSVEMYGVIYGRIISDGDSSTYSNILKARPYKNVTVEKIECRNHLLRNTCTKLKALTSDTRYPKKIRTLISNEKIIKIRKVVKKSVSWLRDQALPWADKVKYLYGDILNAANHVFGRHHACKEYYCCASTTDDQSNLSFDALQTSAIWLRVSLILSNLAAHSRSLLHDVDSNRVEQFNSIIAKFIGGKRINYSLRGSYQARCNAAVVSHNTRAPLSMLSKTILGHSPKSRIKMLEEQRHEKSIREKGHRKGRRRTVFPQTKDQNYGKANAEDMQEAEFELAKGNFLSLLTQKALKRQEIERSTVLQSGSGEWLELHTKVLTASSFGKVCKRRESTSCGVLVKSIVSPPNLTNINSIQHGKKYEQLALKQLSTQENINIQPCGIFIDPHLPYLAATPDGIAGDFIVEVKCPITSFREGFENSLANKKVNFWKVVNGNRVINVNHDWYFQIQGQLHITGRSTCVFGVWSGHDKPVVVEYVERDDKFWEDRMVSKLSSFYMNCLLPEIIDSRLARSKPIREAPGFVGKKADKENNPQSVTSVNTEQTLETQTIRILGFDEL